MIKIIQKVKSGRASYLTLRRFSIVIVAILISLSAFMYSGFARVHADSSNPQTKKELMDAGCSAYGKQQPVATVPGQTPNLPSQSELQQQESACDKGFLAGVQKDAKKISKITEGPCYTSSKLYKGNPNLAYYCSLGYGYGYEHRDEYNKLGDTLTPEQQKARDIQQKADDACTPQIPGATNSSDLLGACVKGYVGAANGKTQDQACADYGPGLMLQFCQKGFQLQSGSGNNNDSAPSCENDGPVLSWLFCKIIDGAAAATDKIYSELVEPMLNTKPINVTDPSGDPTHTYQIWSNFRVYGDIFLILALLVIVFGESIGGGLIDAYSAKKILPRLLIAAVLINLSIYIVALAVDFTNIIGSGVAALIEAPFKVSGTYKIHIGELTGGLGLGTLVAGTAWAVAGAGALLEFLFLMLVIPAFLTFVAILVTVIVRQGLIIFLVLVSPVAFALYCLPNTQQYFRKWWDLLIKTLLVYPLIAVLFAMANVLSVTINQTASGISGAFIGILSAVALFVPLFLIPYSFRIAGGLLGQLHDFATNVRKRGHEAIKGNANDQDSWRNRSRSKLRHRYEERGMTGKGLATNVIPPTNPFSKEGRQEWRQNREARRASSRKLSGQRFLEHDSIALANQGSDQYYAAVASPSLAQSKLAAAGTEAERVSWRQAIANANLTPKTPAIRMAAAKQLAGTGFVFNDGQEGYNEMGEMMADITGATVTRNAAGNIVGATGNRAGAWADAMDDGQFAAKNGGRFDLAGINRGRGWDPEEGLGKVDPYTLASRAKPPSVRAKGGLMRTYRDRALAAAAAGDQTTYHAEMEKAEIQRQELATGWDSATGKNKEAFFAELGTAGPDMAAWANLGTADTTKRRENYVTGAAGWTAEERARGFRYNEEPVTRGDLARQKAQGARRPNAAELEET